ncbi:MAG: PilZ domain-containing protein [Candidatus Omnitrophica bacterium]|nr:PilZ domain-containing protein [Candidatus Omnitrophota bacterium]
MSEEFSVERRLASRVPCFLKGIFYSKENFCQKFECCDISAYGARISTTQPLAIASYVEVAIDSAKVNNLSALGKVCWCAKVPGGWQAGIAFTKQLPFSPNLLM